MLMKGLEKENYDLKKIRRINKARGRIELSTSCLLDRRNNHYATEPFPLYIYIYVYLAFCFILFLKRIHSTVLHTYIRHLYHF